MRKRPGEGQDAYHTSPKSDWSALCKDEQCMSGAIGGTARHAPVPDEGLGIYIIYSMSMKF